MDRVGTRSLLISTAVHAGLAVAALLAVGSDALLAPAPDAVVPPPPTPPQHGDLVLAPETATAPPPSRIPLPTLGPSDLPALNVITAGPMRAPDQADSRGRAGVGSGPIDLPPAAMPVGALSEELRSRTRSQAHTLAQELRSTAAVMIEIRLTSHARDIARPYALRITQRRLLLGVVVDRSGVVREIALLAGSGVPDLDRALRQALTGLSLPPIEAGVTHYFQIDLP